MINMQNDNCNKSNKSFLEYHKIVLWRPITVLCMVKYKKKQQSESIPVCWPLHWGPEPETHACRWIAGFWFTKCTLDKFCPACLATTWSSTKRLTCCMATRGSLLASLGQLHLSLSSVICIINHKIIHAYNYQYMYTYILNFCIMISLRHIINFFILGIFIVSTYFWNKEIYQFHPGFIGRMSGHEFWDTGTIHSVLHLHQSPNNARFSDIKTSLWRKYFHSKINILFQQTLSI